LKDGDEGLGLDGLGKVVVHAGCEAAFAVASHGVGGEGDDVGGGAVASGAWGISESLGSSLSNVLLNQKVEPWPTADWMARPRPVPECGRVAVWSIWEKDSKMRAC